jgi:hypothetical protein
MRVPFRSQVRIVTLWDREWVRTVDAVEAEYLCTTGWANQIIEPRTVFVSHIELTRTREEFMQECGPRDKPKVRPRPSLSADSSTGDAGRGNTQGPRVRALHVGDKAFSVMDYVPGAGTVERRIISV